MKLKKIKKVNGLVCYCKGILCKIEGAKIASHATIKYYYCDFYISLSSSLSFRARSNSLPPGIWLFILRSPESERLGGQQKTRK